MKNGLVPSESPSQDEKRASQQERMAIFDVYIKMTAEYTDELREKGRNVKELDCPTVLSELKEGLPIRVGPQANPGIILRGDTFVELGHPQAGSSGFLLWTKDLSLIRDGRVTLIGPDIQESSEGSLPFGQIVMVAGEELEEKDHEMLIQGQYIADQIEGYMVKSSSRNIWSRVSKDGAAKGFCFETLGRALMAIFKSEILKVQAMEIIFVTSSKDDVRRIDDLAAQVQKISKEIVKETWKVRGYDIECDLDCSSCNDKPVCDNIREVLAERKRKDEEPRAESTV